MNSEEIIFSFKKKKRNSTIVALLFVVMVLSGFVYCEINGVNLLLIIAGIIVLAIPLNIFYFIYWKCPNCNSFLGSSDEIEECPKCKCNFLDEEEREYNEQNKSKSIINKKLFKKFTSKTEISKNIPSYIPDYKKYNIYELVEVYNRIDHQINEFNIKIIEEEIRNKLNIDPIADINSPEIQEKFEEILTNHNPIAIKENENKEISSLLSKVQLIIFIIILLSVFLFLTIYRNDKLFRLSMLFISILILIEFIKTLYTNEVLAVWKYEVNLKENSFLFRLNQFLLVFLFVIITVITLISMFAI